MRKAEVFFMDSPAGILIEDDEGYHFTYYKSYIDMQTSKGISLTLPIQNESFHASTLFPFFDGLIPEGWLLKIAESNWKLDRRDRMGLLHK